MDQTTEKYVEKLQTSASTGKALELLLETDDRVLARVTDGIYRQPASAIRELIANAYDADATEVAVVTDAPRYSQILVRDNGNGMSAEVLINMIQHIGGSAKRTQVGQQLGVTDPQNASRSPGGRKLIGKMGIGLFSVAQLTRRFTIITKPKEEKFRYIAVVTLHRYTDEHLQGATNETRYRTGKTVMTSERVRDDEGHGTTIILGDLIPRARRVLQSEDAWSALHSPPDTAGAVKRLSPIVHSGWLREGSDEYIEKPRHPWTPATSPQRRMNRLSAALTSAAKNEFYAKIENAFDYYFRMVWSLGLALPLPYIADPPFKLPGDTKTRTFLLSNRTRASSSNAGDNQATELDTDANIPVSKAADITVPREGADFHVEVDGLRLLRPIRFDEVHGTSRALQTPLLFVGRFNPDLSKFDKTQRGGQDLEFVGYFYWAPRVIPREHNGLLIRINGASGTLFDSTFLNYQVAERQRLKQVVAEVFVTKGLEEALNIDRESFNTSHPHYQIVLNWVHNSLRQVFNKQKELESALRTRRRTSIGAAGRNDVQKVRDEELSLVLGADEDPVRDVVFSDDSLEVEKAERDGARVYPLMNVVVSPGSERVGRVTDKTGQRVLLNRERAAALVQLLDAYELLENLSSDQQTQLLRGILRIFNSGE